MIIREHINNYTYSARKLGTALKTSLSIVLILLSA